jgi:hypothetical protein
MAKPLKLLALALSFFCGACGRATSERINNAKTPQDLSTYDDSQLCNPLVKATPIVIQERKRRKLPECEQ